MKSYSIISHTDSYHASTDPRFEGHKTERIVDSDLSLAVAQERLLTRFRMASGMEDVSNWDEAMKIDYVPGVAAKTLADGTWILEDDVYDYCIIEEDAWTIFERVGGKDFASMFWMTEDELQVSEFMTMACPHGGLTDEALDLNTLVLTCTGKEPRQFGTLHEAAEYLYDIYNTEPESEE